MFSVRTISTLSRKESISAGLIDDAILWLVEGIDICRVDFDSSHNVSC